MRGIGAIRVLLALGATGFVGWALVRFFSGGLRRSEQFAWSLMVGLLTQSTILLFAAAAGLRPGPFVILASDAAILGFSWIARPFRWPKPGPRVGRVGGLALVLLGVASGAWLAFLFSAVSEPMWSTDYLAIWGLKGKVIYEVGGLPARLFHDPALYWAHREYPLLLPLSLAAVAGLAGEWNDQALALLFPALALATWLAVFGFLWRHGTAVAGGSAALLVALCFQLYHPVNAGTAEVPFALGVVLASCAFLDLLQRDGGEVRARLLAAALLCASFKQEGTLWVALLLMALLFSRVVLGRRQPAWSATWALALAPLVHWILLYALRGPQTRRDFDFSLFAPDRWGALLSRVGSVLARVLTTEAREAVVPLGAIILFLLVTRRGFADVLLPLLAAQIGFYCLACSVSSFDPMYAVDGAFRRITLTLFPALTLVLGARLAGHTEEGDAAAS